MSRKYVDLTAMQLMMRGFLPDWWSHYRFHRGACEDLGTFDPPCAYVESRSFLGTIQVCSDGAWYVQDISGQNLRSGQEPTPGRIRDALFRAMRLDTENPHG